MLRSHMAIRQRAEGFIGQRVIVLPKTLVATALQHPLLTNLMVSSIGYFPKAKGHFKARPAGAEQAIFIYCTQGAGWCEIAGCKHQVDRGSLLLISQGVPHAYGADHQRPWSIYWFHALGASVASYLKALRASPAHPVVALGRDVQLSSHFEEALQGLASGFALPQLFYAVHALSHLLGWMLWHQHEFRQGEIPGQERVARSIKFMKEHLNESLRVETLAAMANLSSSRFTTLFRETTGHPPLEYLIRLRMQQAVQLLSTTDLPIKVISSQVGWPDPLYFSRIFHAFHGHSPTEHRLCSETLSTRQGLVPGQPRRSGPAASSSEPPGQHWG